MQNKLRVFTNMTQSSVNIKACSTGSFLMSFVRVFPAIRLSFVAACLCTATVGWAANLSPASAPTVQTQALNDVSCQKELAKFEQTLGYLRQTSGTQLATTVQDKLLPAKTREDLLAKEGPCGVVRFLREKRVL
jgi:hypothetical protein